MCAGRSCASWCVLVESLSDTGALLTAAFPIFPGLRRWHRLWGSPQGKGALVGVIVCRLERHAKGVKLMRGYIAMLSIHSLWRGRGIARRLASMGVERMKEHGAEEVRQIMV